MSSYLLSRGPLDGAASAWLRTAGGTESRLPGFGLVEGAEGPVLLTEAGPGPEPLEELAFATWQAAEGRRGPVRGFLLHAAEATRRLPRLRVPARFDRGPLRRAGVIEVARKPEGAGPWPGRWLTLRWRDGGAPEGRHERVPAGEVRDETWVVVDPPEVQADDAALDGLMAGVGPGAVRDSAATLLPPWAPPAPTGWPEQLRERLVAGLAAGFPALSRPLLVELLLLAREPLVAQLLRRGARLDAADGVILDPRVEPGRPSALVLATPPAGGWVAETWRRAATGRGALGGRLGAAATRALATDLAMLLRRARAGLREAGYRSPAQVDAPEPYAESLPAGPLAVGRGGPRWVEQEGSHQLLVRLLAGWGDEALDDALEREVLGPARRPLDAAPAWDHHAVEVALAERALGVGADRSGDAAWRTAAMQLLAAAVAVAGGAAAAAEAPAGPYDLPDTRPLLALVQAWRLPGERFPELRFQGEPLATLVYHRAPRVQLRRWRWMLPARCLIRPGVNRLDDELAPLDGGLWLE